MAPNISFRTTGVPLLATLGMVAGMVAATPVSAQLVVTAADDTASTTELRPVEIDVLENDAVDEFVTVHVTSPTSNGSVLQILGNNMIRFTAMDESLRSDNFDYELYRFGQLQDRATVAVSIAGEVQRPHFGHPPYRSFHRNEPLPPGKDHRVFLVFFENGTVVFPSGSASGYRSQYPSFNNVWTGATITEGTRWRTDGRYSERFTGEDKDGPWRSRIRVHDRNGREILDRTRGRSDPDLILVEVNEDPVLQAITAPAAMVDSEVTFTATASDADRINSPTSKRQAQQLTFSLSGAPDQATIDPATGAFAWTPTTADLNPTALTVVVTDPKGATDWQQLSIVVDQGASLPGLLARDDWASTTEDGVEQPTWWAQNGEGVTSEDGVISVVTNDHGVSGTTTVHLVSTALPGNGTATVNGQTITYVPNANFSGTDQFDYELRDGAATSTATVNVVVKPTNDPPVLNMPVTELFFDEGESIDWVPPVPSSEFATDPDGGTLAGYELVLDLLGTVPPGLTWKPFAGGFTWQPDETQDGVYVLRLELSDSDGQAAPEHRITVHILEVNQPPVLSPMGPYVTLRGAPIRFTATASDPDRVNGMPQRLIYSLKRAPAAARIDPSTGVVTYHPPAFAFYPIEFTVVVTDDAGASDEQVVTINLVEAAGDSTLAIDAVDDVSTVREDGRVDIQVKRNDQVPEGATVVLTTAPEYGAVQLVDGEYFRYSSERHFNGTDSFEYGLSVGYSVRDTATVTVVVREDNTDRAIEGHVRNESLSVLEGETVRVTVPVRLPDGTPLNVEAATFTSTDASRRQLTTTDPGDASAAWLTDESKDGQYAGEVTYTDTANSTRRLGFTINVVEVNQPPTLQLTSTTLAATAGTQLTFTVEARETDTILGVPQALTLSMVDHPATATLTPDATTAGQAVVRATFAWTPTNSDPSPSFFTVIATDAAGARDSATVRVTITGGSTRTDVVAAADFAEVDEDNPITVNVLSNDVGAGSSPTVTVVTAPTNGSHTIGTDGRITYTPTDNFHGTDEVVYRVTNGTQTGDGSLRVDVRPVNDAPEIRIAAEHFTFSAPERAEFTWDFPAPEAEGDSRVVDPDGETLSNNQIKFDLEGPVEWIGYARVDGSTGSIRWTPTEADDGVYHLRLRATDLAGASDSVDLVLTVTETQSTPTIAVPEAEYSVILGGTVRVPVTATDTDLIAGVPDALTLTVTSGPASAVVGAVPRTTVGRLGGSQVHNEFAWATAGAALGRHDVTVQVADSAGNTATDSFTVIVRPVPATDAAVVLSARSPAVGDTLSASLHAATYGISATDWHWQRTENIATGTWAAIPSATAATYTVTTADVDHHLRARAGYQSASTRQEAYSTPTLSAVAATVPAAAASDTTNPTVVNVSFHSTPQTGDSYTLGEDIAVAVVFDEVVHVMGAPTLVLVLGSTARTLAYVGGSGSPLLRFRYTVAIGDIAAQGASVRINSLAVAGNGWIRDVAGNDATLAHDAIAAHASHKVGSVPVRLTALRISSDPGADGSYAIGDEIRIEATFDETVLVEDIPELLIMIGEQERVARYSAGTGTNTLTFAHTVQSGDEDGGVISVAANSLRFTNGRIRDQDSTPPSHMHDALPAQANHRVVTHLTEPGLAIAVADSITTPENTAVRIPVLQNDTGPAGLTLSASLENGRAPVHGRVHLDGAVVVYTPNPETHGTDTFTYELILRQQVVDTAEVTVMVTEVNDPPTLTVDANSLIIREGETMSVQLHAHDPEGADLTYGFGGLPGGSIDPTTGLYTWETGERDDGSGTDAYFSVTDSVSGVEVRTPNLRYVVQEVNVVPQLGPVESKTVNTGQLVIIRFDQVATNPDFINGQKQDDEFSLAFGPRGANINFNNTKGSFVWRAGAQYAGTTQTVVAVFKDAAGAKDILEVPITIRGTLASPPAAQDDWVRVAEDGRVTIDVLANDHAAETDSTVRVAAGSLPAHGTVEVQDRELLYSPAPNSDNDDQFGYELFNPGQATAVGTATVYVTVTPVDDPPVLAVKAARLQLAEGETVDWDPKPAWATSVASDPDGETLANGGLTLKLIGPPPSSLTMDPLTGRLSGTLTESDDGEYSLQYVLQDRSGATMRHSLILQVEEVNQAPVLPTRLARTVNVGVSLEWPVVATDPDVVQGMPQRLAYSLYGAPAGASIDSASGLLRWTPAASDRFREYFSIIVVDAAGAMDSRLVELDVVGGDDSANTPFVTAMNDEARTMEDQSVRIDVLANDVSNLLMTLELGGVAPRHGQASVELQQIVYTPNPDFHGTDTFEYDAVANEFLSTRGSVTVTVTAVNDPPVLEPIPITDRHVMEGENMTFTLQASDVDGDNLQYQAAGIPTGASFDATTGTFTWPTTEANDGALPMMRFTVSDGTESVSTPEGSFQVLEVNSPPDLQTIGDRTGAVGSRLRFKALATDPDVIAGVPDALTFALVNAPPDASINSRNGTFSWTPPATALASNRFAIQVTDAAGALDWEEIVVTVTGLSRPTALDAHDDNIYLGAGTSVEIAVLNNDDGIGSSPTVALIPSERPRQGTVTLSGNTFTYLARRSFSGTDRFTYQVTDADAISTARVNLTIVETDSNRPPIITLASDLRLNHRETDSISWNPSLTVYDPDGETLADGGLTVTLGAGAPAGLALDVHSEQPRLRWSPGETGDGSHPVELVVIDRAGAAARHTITLVVEEINQPPVLAVQPARAARIGTPLRFMVTVSDPDIVAGQPQRLTWSVRLAPTAVMLNSATGEVTWTPGAADFGDHNFEFRVTDTSGASDVTMAAISVTGSSNADYSPGAVVITGAGPAVDTPLTAVLNDRNGGVGELVWQWQRAAVAPTPTWANIASATLATYTPLAADAGMRLRATATYTDSTGPSQAAYSPATPAVASTAVTVTAPSPDTTGPTVIGLGVTSPTTTSRIYGVGSVIEVSVVFSEAVQITGTPTLALTIGQAERSATYLRGDDTPALVFGYEVEADNLAEYGVATPPNALAIPATGSIQDGANNSATITHPAMLRSRNHRVDGRLDQPTTVSITGGEFDSAAGTVSGVLITFSRAVTGLARNEVVVSSGTVAELGPGDEANQFAVTVTDVEDGTLTVSLPAGVATDWHGTATPAASSQEITINRPGQVAVTMPGIVLRATIPLTATLTDPSGGIRNQRWVWQRSPRPTTPGGTPDWQNILGAVSSTYVPTSADADHLLRVTVAYDDSAGTDLRVVNQVGEVLAANAITPDTVGVLNVDGDQDLDALDARLMYFAFALPQLLGDGVRGGFPEFRQLYIAPLFRNTPDDATLQAAIQRARALQSDRIGDFNEDGQVTEDDALIMYYAFTMSQLLGNGTSGGEPHFRQTFLGRLSGTGPDPTDEDMQNWLKLANLANDTL